MRRIDDWLTFELRDADALVAELQATPKQVRFALSRAATRVATTLRKRAARGMADQLELRAVMLLRNRLKAGRIRGVRARGEQFGGGARLWFGLNPMPVRWFKGRPRQTARGAVHRGTEFEGAFVGQAKVGRKYVTIFRRQGAKRIPIAEQTIDVDDRMQTYIEDELFHDVDELFWRTFERDLRARVKYKLGGA